MPGQGSGTLRGVSACASVSTYLLPPVNWRWSGRLDERRKQLAESLLLAALLHLLLVLLLGNAPGGQAQPGEGVWGRLSVRLALDEPQARSGPPVPPPPEAGPVGEGKNRRYGGAVRAPDDAAARLPDPGAARQGRWSSNEAPKPPAETGADGRGRQPEAEAPPAPLTAPVPETLAQTSPEASPPPAAALATLPAPSALPLPMGPAAIEPLRRHAAADPGPAVAPLPVAPTVPRRLEASALQAGPARIAEAAAPAAPQLAMTELKAAPRLRLPSAKPADIAPVVEQAMPSLAPAPALSLPEPAAVRTREALPAPVTLERNPPAAAMSRMQAADAPVIEPLPVAPTVPPRTLAAPANAGLERSTAAAAAPQTIPPRAFAADSAAAMPLVPAPPPLPAAPDAGARTGHDVATPPSASASAVPRLNLSLPRAGEVSVRTSRGLLEVLPVPPERKSKVGESIDAAARTDCRDAHRDAGLVGGIAVAADTLRGKGCRW